MGKSEISYRADIDGLRGIAVLSVLGFHIWGNLIHGGYVGVDVFFVISGYLITTIIHSELQSGRFTLSAFYARRVKRILPALFVLLCASALFSAIFILPIDEASFAHSMVATALSVSNFYFWKTSNYFDAPSSVLPLLHTWSLAVEEQFYIIFPVFLMVSFRYFRNQMRRAVVFLAVASFVWSVIEVRHDPGAAFFVPMSRAWELLLGTILALGTIPIPSNRFVREVLGLGGLLAILGSVLFFNVNTPFPGARALYPCVGTSLIILTGGTDKSTLTSQLLSAKPLVFIGLISYSLYLWHWPLLVFSKIAVVQALGPLSIGGRFLLTLIAIAVAAFSWRFVETPFRVGIRQRKGVVLAGGAICIGMTVLLALFVSASSRTSKRFPGSVMAVSAYLDYKTSHPDQLVSAFGFGPCYLDRREPISDYDERSCLEGGVSQQEVLILGDSHAANLRIGLQTAFPNVRFLQAACSSCPPTLTQNQLSTSECRQFTNRVIRDLIPKHSIHTVLLNALWSANDLKNMDETVTFLKNRGVRVIVFGPFPIYKGDLPRVLSGSILNSRPDFAALYLDTHQNDLDMKMSRIAREEWKVAYVSPFTLLCPQGKCVEYAGPEIPMEFDNSHLTLEGSKYLGNAVRKEFPKLLEAN